MSEADPPRGPNQSHDDESTSSQVTACRRCRKQKLRCSRDFPTCKRCRDVPSVCEYPLPPDRKLLAAQRLQNTKARARQESESSSNHANVPHGRETPVSQYNMLTLSDSIEESDHGAHEVHQVLTPPVQTVLKRTTMPSSEVAMFLIEIYFARMYNAHFLFHKETFILDFAANKVPDFVALAVFASASIFLRQPQEKSQQSTGSDGAGVELGLSMLSTADWASQGDEWANAAGQQTLMQADLPRIEIVQACQCLGLYWWAIGESERTYILSHNAYMNARFLGLHVQSDDLDPVVDEFRRRLFWGCWMTQCIGQENASFKAAPWKDAIGIKFISDEESWHAKRPNPKQMFDENGDIVNYDRSEVSPTPSESGEFIKLLDLWWEVQRFLECPREDTPQDALKRCAALLDLDRRLGKVFDNFHPYLQYQTPLAFTSPKIDKYNLFTLHCLYRSTNCALHSSVVPLFSNVATNPHASKKAIRLSAKESVKHSAIILDMATTFMSSCHDISRLPSVVGFAMFVASTIQFKSLQAQRKLQTYGAGRFKAAIYILDRLKAYWASLEHMWTGLKSMFVQAGINIDAIPADPRYQLDPDDQNKDLDQIVSYEGTPQSGDGGAIYRYVAGQERKSDASPRCSSDGHSSHNRRSKSAQNTPSPGSMAINAEGQQQTLPIHQHSDAQSNPNVQDYAPQHQYSQLQSSALPHSQSFGEAQQSFSNYPFRHQSSSAMNTTNFTPLGTVPEGYQAQTLASGISYRTMTTSEGVPGINAFGDMLGTTGTEMEVDGMNCWWDQSYGTFGIEVIDPNVANMGGETYQFQNFSLGYGAG